MTQSTDPQQQHATEQSTTSDEDAEPNLITSDVEIERQPVTALQDVAEDDDVEVLGHIVWSTTGELIVPREWLIEQLEAIDRGRQLIPSETWPSSAYKLAMSHLLMPQFRAVDEVYIDGYKITWRLERVEQTYFRHLFADIHVPEDESGEVGGTVASAKTATFNYEREAQTMSRITRLADMDEDDQAELPDVVQRLYDPLVSMTNRHIENAEHLFEEMQESHDSQDLRRIFYHLRDEGSHAVPLRHGGAVYFFPIQYASTVEGLADIWERMNRFKHAGHECEIATVPVIDSEQQRSLIHRHVERALAGRVDSAIEDGLARLTEVGDEEDEQADPAAIAATIVGELEDTVAMAREYEALLEHSLSVREPVRGWLDRVEEGSAQQRVVEIVISELSD